MLDNQPTHIICHYSEIALKGNNRIYFEKVLKINIRNAIDLVAPKSIKKFERLRGRFLIHLSEHGQSATTKVIGGLKDVFGLAYFALAYKSETDIGIIKNDCIELMRRIDFESFRITARCINKQFPFSGQSLNEVIGAEILEKLKKKVNLSEPEVTCYIDVLDEGTFLYNEKISAQNGLPVGTSGKVVVMLSGGIDSPVAAYYALKRGMEVIYVHFHSAPLVSEASIEKVKDTVEVLSKYQRKSKLYLAKFADIQQAIMVECNPKLRVILYRRYMMMIAEKIAIKENAKAIYTGEALGQVASQTIENISVVEDAVDLPILRPLIGFDKQEIIRVAETIGTYEISILPHQDCCTLYVPKHPATKARLQDVVKNEAALDSEGLIKHALESVEIEIY